MPEYYGGAPNAFAGGQEFGAAQRARKIKENALNALIAKYGPEAADPQAAAMMQRTQQSSELHPYDLAEAQRVDAARAAAVQGRGVQAGDAAGEMQGIELEDRENAQKIQVGQRAAAMLEITEQRGGDMNAAFDMIERVLPEFGLPVEKLAEARQAFVSDPEARKELIALLRDSSTGRKAMSGGQAFYDTEGKYGPKGALVWGVPTTDGGIQVTRGLTPATAAQGDMRIAQRDTSLAQNARKLTQDDLKMRGLNPPAGYEAWLDPETNVVSMAPIADTKEAQDFEKNLREVDTADSTFVRSAAAMNENSAQIIDSVDTALEFFKRADGGILLQNLRRGAEFYAGMDLREAKKALDTVSNKVAVEELLAMKKASPNGASGFGALQKAELDLLKDSKGILQVTRDPEVLVKMLERIKASYAQAQKSAAEDAQVAQQRMEQRRQQYGPELKAPRAPAAGRAPGWDDSLDALLDKYAPVRR